MSTGLYTTEALGRLDPAHLARRSRVSLEWPWLRRHGPWLAGISAIAVWLCRRVLFTSALPAGTDILGFVTRAQQNAHLSEITSPWTPSSLGAVRQFTLDNLLGAITLITRDPVVTVKLLIFLTLFVSGASAYALSWRWYRDRQAAAFAGLFFMLSQASLTRWGSGELNVEMAVASAPLIILAWDACMRRTTVRRLIVLALTLGAVFLVRPDMVLYATPFLVIHALVHASLSGRASLVFAEALRTAAIGIVALFLLLAAQAVPLLFGLRAHWLTTASLFSPHDFAQRSLDAYPSLLGFGREIGYFAFTGQQTWYSHPWLPSALYEMLAAALLLLAIASLYRHRGPRTLFLVGSIACGAFLAKGIRSPLGQPYTFLITHVPAFGNLRDPNRWLIVPSVAVSVLSGLTFVYLVRSGLRHVGSRPRPRVATILGSGAAIGVLLLPVGPTVARGFMTWRPTTGQMALMKKLSQDRSHFAVATIPYDQTYRFLTQGNYHGYEHDLGAESAAFTGHPVLSDGGWQQSTANFVSFTVGLLGRGDPAFSRLLGTVGVKYLLDFKYPETAPHLVPQGLLSRPHLPGAGTWHQQQAWSAIRPSRPLIANGAGSLNELPTWSQPVSLRSNFAVIFGGLAGTAAFADLPGVHIQRWAAVQSDDAVSQGLPRLLALIRSADLLVIANESVNSTAILAVPPVADVAGMTSNPDLEHLTQLLNVDQSVRNGSLANQSLPASLSGVHRVASTFTLARPKVLQLWARVEASRSASTLVFRLDGRRVGTYTPVALHTGPMVWHRVGSFALASGKHTFGASARSSLYGDSYEIDELRVLDRAQLQRTKHLLAAAIAARAHHLIISVDTSSIPLGLQDKSLFRLSKTVTATPRSFWTILENEFARSSSTQTATAPLTILVSGQRRLYTIAQHTFETPQDWRRRNYLFMQFGGDAGGSAYHLFVDFNRQHVGSAEYDLPASSPTPHMVALATADARSAIPVSRWGHVVSVRITSDSRDMAGSLALGKLGISGRVGPVSVRYPVPCELGKSYSVAGPAIRTRRAPCAISLEVRPNSPKATRFSEGSSIRERPAGYIRYRSVSPTSYAFTLKSHARGWLMLDQSFDSRWTLHTGSSASKPLPIYSAVTGFPVTAGKHSGTISLRGVGIATGGVLASGLGLLLLIGLAIADPPIPRLSKRSIERRGPRKRLLRVIPRREPSFWMGCIAIAAVILAGRSIGISIGLCALTLLVYRVEWWMCLGAAALLVGLLPFVEMATPPGANALAVVVVALLAGAVLLILAEERRRFARSFTPASR